MIFRHQAKHLIENNISSITHDVIETQAFNY